MEKRIVWSYVLLISLAAAMVLRVGRMCSTQELKAAAVNQGLYTLTIGEERGTIYDRNFKPMVNNSSKTILAVAPGPEALAALKGMLPKEQFDQYAQIMESRKPFALTTAVLPESKDGVSAFSIPIRYGVEQTAPHVIGYVDESGHGVTGIEKGYDELLDAYSGSLKVKYMVDAWGGVLGSEPYEIQDGRAPDKGGVVLTLERGIQKITEKAAEKLQKGAVVVMDTASGEILAMVSVPTFDIADVGAALEQADSPLFNRATAAYNVGSTFKLCVAAAALEKGISIERNYTCLGYYQLGEQRYHCHKRDGHGTINMVKAIEQSCNPYFIGLGQEIGAQSLYDMAYAMGFGSPARLADGISSAAGSLPSISQISQGELANLSFGQGKLTATPVQIAQMLSVIGNGGMSVSPSLCRGVTLDGSHLTKDERSPSRRVLSKQTSHTLCALLQSVVEEGSGKKAAPQYLTAGGKTASAQTGAYVGDKEIVHGWFAGLYPMEEPRYAIVVFSEGGDAGGNIPALVFREICEGLFLQGGAFFSSFTG